MLCREEAVDLCALIRQQASAPPVIGVCKEEESDGQSELGIAEFQSKYFTCGSLHLNEGRELFEVLGNRRISLPMGKLLNPFRWSEVRSDLKAMKERTDRKKVEGNMKGDGLVQGGVLVVGPAPTCEVLYTYFEETGSVLPVQDIEQAITDLAGRAIAS